MANLYPFHGHSPQIDPGAFVADTATIVGDVTKKGPISGPASSYGLMKVLLLSARALIFRIILSCIQIPVRP